MMMMMMIIELDDDDDDDDDAGGSNDNAKRIRIIQKHSLSIVVNTSDIDPIKATKT